MLLHGLMFVALTAGFAADDNATKIVGVWVGTVEKDGISIKVTMEFTKAGKATATIDIGKKDITIDGTYKVEKDKLTLTRNFNGKDMVETNTIKELTADKLILIDDAAKVEITFKKK